MSYFVSKTHSFTLIVSLLASSSPYLIPLTRTQYTLTHSWIICIMRSTEYAYKDIMCDVRLATTTGTPISIKKREAPSHLRISDKGSVSGKSSRNLPMMPLEPALITELGFYLPAYVMQTPPADSPKKLPSTLPNKLPQQTPQKNSPADSPSRLPKKTPQQTPPTNSPADSPKKTPQQTPPTNSPADSPKKTPQQTPQQQQ
ncbi:uncharacterized protein LOC134767481 [Penaeus indicus]|uniref:uncharacterized protein LOC134767481 n=1 Tax=Penaeus indicus TaxID=29960 RepID=UPI00300DAEFD